MHAILHDAAGFVHEVYYTGPLYCYMLPWKNNNSLIGHFSGVSFCLFNKPFVRMLSERSVVLDFENFRCEKSNFIIKEPAITTSDHSNSLTFFLPPVSFNFLQ